MSPRRLRTWVAVLCAGASAGVAAADTISIVANHDNTLYEYFAVDGDRSNGSGMHLFAGRTAEGKARRGVLSFDVASAVPAGSTITGATLQLSMSKTITGATTVSLKRVLASWGEGASNAGGDEGSGAPAAAGDATWRHRFFSGTFWGTPGGDLSGVVSATQSVDGIGLYTWNSAQLVADVQSMLDSPAGNFGWAVIGDESGPTTAKRFDTREIASAALRPTLMITYVPEPATMLLAVAGLLAVLRRRCA
jgi:hypothetical protein